MKISIITASYNYENYIKEAIESVINQTYSDWELIIVDDGSSDNSVEIIKSYLQKDSRIKFFQHGNGQNKGLKETLLLGLKAASGDWIAFLESDDLLTPDNLFKKVEIVKNTPNANLIFNKVDFILENGYDKKLKGFKKTQKTLAKNKYPKNMFFDFYTKNMILTFSCVMVKKSQLKPGFFQTPIPQLLDWWLWIHLAHKNDFYYINQPLTLWRRHETSYLGRKKLPFNLIQLQAYKDVFKTDGKTLKEALIIPFLNLKLAFALCYRALKRIIKSI